MEAGTAQDYKITRYKFTEHSNSIKNYEMLLEFKFECLEKRKNLFVPQGQNEFSPVF